MATKTLIQRLQTTLFGENLAVKGLRIRNLLNNLHLNGDTRPYSYSQYWDMAYWDLFTDTKVRRV